MQETSENQEWIVVKKNKKNYKDKNIKSSKIQNKGASLLYNYQKQSENIEQYLKSSSFASNKDLIKKYLAQITPKDKVKIICLGLGNFLTNYKSHLQYYFLKYCLIGTLKEMTDSFELTAFDPVFSKDEQQQIQKIGGCIQEGILLQLNTIHIIFMPHCQRILYEELCKLKLEQFSKQKLLDPWKQKFIDLCKQKLLDPCKQNQEELDLKKNRMSGKVLVIGNSIKQYIQRCILIKESIPDIFTEVMDENDQKLHEFKLLDYLQAMNDTYVYQL